MPNIYAIIVVLVLIVGEAYGMYYLHNEYLEEHDKLTTCESKNDTLNKNLDDTKVQLKNIQDEEDARKARSVAAKEAAKKHAEELEKQSQNFLNAKPALDSKNVCEDLNKLFNEYIDSSKTPQ